MCLHGKIHYRLLWYQFSTECLTFIRPSWNGWNGTRLFVVVRSIPSCFQVFVSIPTTKRKCWNSCEELNANGNIQDCQYKTLKSQLWVRPCEWLKLNFASYVVHQIFTQIIVRPYSMFYPYEGCRSVTPLDAARVNRTIFRNHSVHWYYITLIRVGIISSTIFL